MVQLKVISHEEKLDNFSKSLHFMMQDPALLSLSQTATECYNMK